ncbi:MAG: M20/M25/M40 family metallo-hydrolase [Gemmatimonadales bacterium]
MMTKQCTTLVLALGIGVAGSPDAVAQNAPDSAAVARVLAHVRYLAADAREGRGVGTTGLDSAAAYVARQFGVIGLTPAGSEGFFQPFEIDPSAPAVAHAGIGRTAVKNVVGMIPGRGPLASQVVVLGAHYDHLGLGGMGSLDPDSIGIVHNGADDNASGTAALLEAARRLRELSAPSYRTLVFVAFTAEELGLIGSEHYVRNPVFPTDSTYAMINFDMVGRLRHDTLLVVGTGSAEELPELLEQVNARHGFVLRELTDPWGRSDHSSFYGQRIPVVHLFTNTHADYHRSTDDWQYISGGGIVRVAAFATDLAWLLVTRQPKLAFVDVPQPQPAAGGGGYGAYLGTIPDMTESPGGVRLTGVRAGSPAERAGIRRGDILIQLGDHEVKDLYDMTDALRAHKPGDVVTVIVLREGEHVELTATLGKRGG